MKADTVRIQLEPSGIVLDVPRGASLRSPLALHGIEFPCGGTGLCGGCRVRVLQGSLGITTQDSLFFSAEDLTCGWRLACQATADVPLVLECEQWHMDILGDNAVLSGRGKRGLGIAIDLGTTTIAAQLIDLATGNVLAVETELNPQAPFGSDVMSRIRAALAGSDLTTWVRATIGSIVSRLARHHEQDIVEIVLGRKLRDASLVFQPGCGAVVACTVSFSESLRTALLSRRTWLEPAPILLHPLCALSWRLCRLRYFGWNCCHRHVGLK